MCASGTIASFRVKLQLLISALIIDLQFPPLWGLNANLITNVEKEMSFRLVDDSVIINIEKETFRLVDDILQLGNDFRT